VAGGRGEGTLVSGGSVALAARSDGTAAVAVVTPRVLLAVFVPAIVLLNVANAIAVYLYHHRHHHGGRFFQEFSLDREANVPSWFSSALLLTAAAVLALVALDALARKSRWVATGPASRSSTSCSRWTRRRRSTSGSARGCART
jgi:hypothetical protein